jgi:hypothetical protein
MPAIMVSRRSTGEAGGGGETTADSSPVGPLEKAQTLVSGRFRATDEVHYFLMAVYYRPECRISIPHNVLLGDSPPSTRNHLT